MSKRKTTDSERALFRKTIAQSRPVKAVSARPKVGNAAPAAASGLDGNTAERLKRGAQAPQARLDLHGFSEAAAHTTLLAFLTSARREGLRLVLVITGKGNPGDDTAGWAGSAHGVLKQMVPRWLNEKPFAAVTAGSGAAHRRHGGDGALYVYLRKNR